MVLSNAIICICCLSSLFESLLLGACRSAHESILAERKICSVVRCLNALNIILFFYSIFFFFPCTNLGTKKSVL